MINRKTISVAIILVLFFAATLSIWNWKKVKTWLGGEITTGLAEEEKQREIEEQIGATKKRLEELSKLSPEEKKEREAARETLAAQKFNRDVPVAGVEVSTESGKKIIKNRAQGYQMEAPDNLIIARSVASDWIELHDAALMCEGDPLCDPILRIRVQEGNEKKLPIGEWLEEEEKKSSGPIYSPREKLIIGGETAYKVTEEIPGKFEGYYYYWSRGEKIYYLRVSALDDETQRPYIDTFRFEDK